MRPYICFGGGEFEGECPHRAEQTNGRIGLKEMGDGWMDGWLQLHRQRASKRPRNLAIALSLVAHDDDYYYWHDRRRRRLIKSRVLHLPSGTHEAACMHHNRSLYTSKRKKWTNKKMKSLNKPQEQRVARQMISGGFGSGVKLN
jgi:hypothetical protein